MLTVSVMNADKAGHYYDNSKEYYSKKMVNRDRISGRLAERAGIAGQSSKEIFEEVIDSVKHEKVAGYDLCFSADKSISMALAESEETRNAMYDCQQEAINGILEYIQDNGYIKVKVNGKIVSVNEALFFEFNHDTARPSERNDFIPDLDMHTHVYMHKKVIINGKEYAINARNLMNEQVQKELGLVYRQKLAKALQKRGFELEIMDKKQGFFQLKGFSSELRERYSARRKDILEAEEISGNHDRSQLNLLTRQTKDKATKGLDGILESVNKDVFQSRKFTILRKKGFGKNDERNERENARNQRENQLHEQWKREQDIQRNQRIGQEKRSYRTGRKYRLQDLQNSNLDSRGTQIGGVLSEDVLNRLGQLQSIRGKNLIVQCKRTADRRERIRKISEEVISDLSKEKFAFSVKEAEKRIMAAGVLEAISKEEAHKTMEQLKLIKLGRMKGDKKNVYLTTKQNIEIENNIIERMKNGKQKIKDTLSIDESRKALDKAEATHKSSFTIQNGEQGEAVHHIMTCKDQFLAVDGLAGTGKTTMAERLKWIAEDQNIKIYGACFTGKAADGLMNESGIDSTTIHSFLNKLEKDGEPEASKKPQKKQKSKQKQEGIKQEWDFSNVKKAQGREIWLVDEAGLVDDRLMNELQNAAVARNAQVVFLGDPQQLPPVGAGEPMRAMEQEGMATAKLNNIRRQKDLDLLQAVKESVQGDHLLTFEALEKKGDYREVSSRKERMQEIKDIMTDCKLDKYNEQLLLTATNADRQAYNRVIRAEFVKKGELEKGKEFEISYTDSNDKEIIEKRNFAKKDRMIFLANDKRIGVMNGTLATVKSVQGNIITAQTDAGKIVKFDADKYKSFDHAYAVTEYKAQGMTVKKVVADMNTQSKAQSRNSLYVDISRAKEKAIVFTDDKKKLEKQTKEFAKKITSADFKKQILAMKENQGVYNNFEYKAPEKKKDNVIETLADKIRRDMKTIEENRNNLIMHTQLLRKQIEEKEKAEKEVIKQQKKIEKPEIKDRINKLHEEFKEAGFTTEKETERLKQPEQPFKELTPEQELEEIAKAYEAMGDEQIFDETMIFEDLPGNMQKEVAGLKRDAVFVRDKNGETYALLANKDNSKSMRQVMKKTGKEIAKLIRSDAKTLKDVAHAKKPSKLLKSQALTAGARVSAYAQIAKANKIIQPKTPELSSLIPVIPLPGLRLVTAAIKTTIKVTEKTIKGVEKGLDMTIKSVSKVTEIARKAEKLNNEHEKEQQAPVRMIEPELPTPQKDFEMER